MGSAARRERDVMRARHTPTVAASKDKFYRIVPALRTHTPAQPARVNVADLAPDQSKHYAIRSQRSTPPSYSGDPTQTDANGWGSSDWARSTGHPPSQTHPRRIETIPSKRFERRNRGPLLAGVGGVYRVGDGPINIRRVDRERDHVREGKGTIWQLALCALRAAMKAATADRPLAVPAASKEAFKRIFTYPLLRHSEMPEELRREAMKLITGACQSHPNNNQSAAQQIKETLDAKYGGSWHAVVGEQFGFEVSHEPESLLYMFFGGNLAICVWKCS
uniref:Dynein axonemal light chain 4 n=1 Tax=Plectus sambesii TaxID=2011161 RepID=A0A914WNG3_9BILA